MDGRSPERGSSRGPETGPAPQTRKTRRELRAEREAAERAAAGGGGTGEQPTRPAQPALPKPWEPEEAPDRGGAMRSGPSDALRDAQSNVMGGALREGRGGGGGGRGGRPGGSSWFDQDGPNPRTGAGRPEPKTAPRPWDAPDPDERRPPERPERGPLDERFPARPTPFAGMPLAAEDKNREAAMRSTGMARRPAASLDEEEEDFQDDHEEPEPRKPVDPRKHRRTGIWLFVVALMLALWSATMFVDSASPLITVPSAVIPLVTICSLPVIAIGVGGKHFVSTGIAALAALLPWAMVAGYASSRDSPAGELSMVRVITVEGSHGAADADAITDVAREYAADVVIVTGLNTTLAHDLTVAGLDQQAPAQGVVQVSGDGSNGIGIWSRLAVEDLTELEGFTKPAASGVLEAGTARIGMTIAQLPGSTLMPGEGWREDIDRLAEQKTSGTETGSFLVGDLNAAPWQPAFRALEKAGWEDAADVAGKGLRPTWPAWSPLPVTPADHLLVDQGIGVTSTATVDIAGSSHRALVVSLEVPTG